MNTRAWQIGVPAIASVLCIALGLSLYGPDSDVVVAPLIDSPPLIDGQRESLWDIAAPIRIPLRGGLSRVRHVDVRAVHDGSQVCFLLEWPDPAESLERAPWEFDGSEWRRLPAAEFYEDKAAFYWPIGPAKSFEGVGCAALCHYGGGKSGGLHAKIGWPGRLNIGAHYTQRPGELMDEWHWKASRTNPFNQLDDGYLNGDRPSAEHETGGRFADEPKETGGGYADNVTDDGTRPAFDFPVDWSGGRLLLWRSGAAPIDDSAGYRPGDRVPCLLLAPLAGRRGEVTAKGAWRDGEWTLEIRRAIDTGDAHDVSFTDRGQRYAFSVAIFDAQQFEHSYGVGVQWLELE